MKTEYVAPVLGLMGFLAYSGLLPLWTSIFAFSGVAIYLGTEAARMFRGSSDTGFEIVTSQWVSSLYERESTKPIPLQSWNCRNCGGPNINQIRCEYCGRVKE